MAVFYCYARQYVTFLRKVYRFRLTIRSQTSIGLLMVLHVALLALVATTPYLRHPASLVAGALAVVGTGAAGIASIFEHTRSVAPSSILQTYFATVILFDMAKVRTLWLIDNSPPAMLLGFILGFEVLIFALESLRKTRCLMVEASTEERSGLLERALFSWLLSMLLRGYSNTLSLMCLPTIDSDFESRVLHDQLLNHWHKSKMASF